ncbi:MAG: thiamine pyrophosphate-dependent enzyme, partial [Pseudomonadota bacterium]
VIDITAEPNRHYMHRATVNIVAETSAGVTALRSSISEDCGWPDDAIAEARAGLSAAFPRDDDWGPAAVIDTVAEVLPCSTLATADSGAHRILLSQMWQCKAAGSLMQSSAFCTMGAGVPLAIGAALANPERTVVSFSGDAGFLMVCGELTTAAELGTKPIFVVFVDASLALIEMKQRSRQLPNCAVDFGKHDIAALGRALGGEGVRVSSREDLKIALQTAQNADTFTVIAAEIERQSYDGRI